MKEIEEKSLEHAWKIQRKFIFNYQLLCTFELRKFWTKWVQKVAKADKVSLLIEKFKLSLLEGGIFRSPLMSFSVEKKNLNLIFWFNKLVLLVKEESCEPTFWNAEIKTLQRIQLPNHYCISGLSPLFVLSSLLANIGTVHQAARQCKCLNSLWQEYEIITLYLSKLCICGGEKSREKVCNLYFYYRENVQDPLYLVEE